MRAHRSTFILFLGAAALVLAADKLTPASLIKDADKHHTKDVVVVGKVSDFEQKTSKIGNKYFVFKLKEGDSIISVYSRGEAKPVLKDGDKVEANGIFRKEKKVSTFTVKNEVDITAVKDKPYGFKKVD